MKKLFLILSIAFISVLSLQNPSIGALDLENEFGNGNDQADHTGDSLNDLVYTATGITEQLLVLYVPDLNDSNSSFGVELWDGTTLRTTIYPSWQGWVLIDLEDLTTYFADIDKIVLFYYNDLVHIYDSPTFASVYGNTILTQSQTLYSYLEYEFTLTEESSDSAWSRGFYMGTQSVTAIIDEDNDTFDDDSFDEGHAVGYQLALDEQGGSLDWIASFFSLFDTIFAIELLPNLTIGILLGISLIPPLVIGVIKWLS